MIVVNTCCAVVLGIGRHSVNNTPKGDCCVVVPREILHAEDSQAPFDADVTCFGLCRHYITQRKRSEALLRAANEATQSAQSRLSDAIENMSEAIVVYDVDDRLVLCNSRFKEFYHHGADDVLPSVL